MRPVGEERGANAAAPGDESTTLVGPDQSWHGPASVAGSVVGSLGALLLLAFAGTSATTPDGVHYLLPWTLGLPMLIGRGAVRRFGVGLLASGLLLPAVPAMILLVATALHGQ